VAAPEPLELKAAAEGRAATLFLAMGSQWRWAGMGERVGLDYAAIEPTARLAGVELDAQVFAGLRVMEAEALSVWARRRGHG
jgi:hypothetical protein